MKKTHIYSNPSHQRSLIRPTVVKNEIKSYLDLYLEGINNSKNIKIFTDMEYKFVFYDDTYGDKRSITGLVLDVYPDQIKIKYIGENGEEANCKNCGKMDCSKRKQWPTTVSPMPSCGCILNPPDVSKYKDPCITFIPVANIMNVSYIQNATINPPIGIDKPPHHHKREGVKVMILGISATVVKAIIIQLKFFDDNADEAVKYVELEKDNIYDITYEDKGTIYECRAKIIDIKECDHVHHGMHDHHHPPMVRENVGMFGEVYQDDCSIESEKDHFMNEPPVRDIKLIVDTSDQFDGNLEVIMLNTIRDCNIVTD